MNNTAVINIRTDFQVKKQAQEIVKKLGLNLSAVINAYLRQLIRTKSITFSLSEKPTNYLLKTLRNSKEDIKEGFVSPAFDNVEGADEWLDNPKAKYENRRKT